MSDDVQEAEAAASAASDTQQPEDPGEEADPESLAEGGREGGDDAADNGGEEGEGLEDGEPEAEGEDDQGQAGFSGDVDGLDDEERLQSASGAEGSTSGAQRDGGSSQSGRRGRSQNSHASPLGVHDDDESDEEMQRYDELTRNSRSGGSRRSRPGSAVIDLRGSRPNSAAVAQEIEGFEDDFMERVEEEEADEEMEEEDEEDEELGPSVEELVERARAEAQHLAEANEALQRRVRLALDFRNRGRPQVNRDLSRLDGAAARYKSSLKQWIEALEERDDVEAHYQSTIFDMKSTLEERIKRADDISKAYKHFRLEVAKSAEHSKTGRTINDKLLAQLEGEDQEKEEEVQRVRLKNIHLSNQLHRIEHTLRQKEELAEGLHLIDFEQLKIENQSLNEKIEERNEELLKLRKKTTTTVQILTHVREKLQFIEKENASLTASLDSLEHDLADKRDRLGKAKAARDMLRNKGRKIQEGSVYITNAGLLDDIEVQKERKEALAAVVVSLRSEYNLLSATVSRTNNRLMEMAVDMASQQTAQQQALKAALSRAGSSKSMTTRVA